MIANDVVIRTFDLTSSVDSKDTSNDAIGAGPNCFCLCRCFPIGGWVEEPATAAGAAVVDVVLDAIAPGPLIVQRRRPLESTWYLAHTSQNDDNDDWCLYSC